MRRVRRLNQKKKKKEKVHQMTSRLESGILDRIEYWNYYIKKKSIISIPGKKRMFSRASETRFHGQKTDKKRPVFSR